MSSSSLGARTVTACKDCRSRKIKCSGHQPICDACRKSGHRCEYPPGSKRRLANRDPEATPSEPSASALSQPQSHTIDVDTATTSLRDVLDWNLEPLDLPESLLAALNPGPRAEADSSFESISHSPTRGSAAAKSRLRIPYFRCVNDSEHCC